MPSCYVKSDPLFFLMYSNIYWMPTGYVTNYLCFFAPIVSFCCFSYNLEANNELNHF